MHQSTGKIEAGMDADLVLLKGDPADDITNFTRVSYTLHQGKIVFHEN